MAAMSSSSGCNGGSHLNARERRPLGNNHTVFNAPAFGSPAHEHIPVDDKGQHTVRRSLLDHFPAAGSAEAEPGVIGKLGVLFRKLPMTGHLIHTRRIGGHPACPALHQHIGKGHGLEGIQCGQWGGFRSPERMVVRQRQQQEALHAPVWTARGVIVFSHIHLRVAVTDGQDAVSVKDVLRKPPLKIPHDNAFHHRQGQWFQSYPDTGRPEAVLCKTICQTAAKRQSRTVCIKPVDKLPGK